MFRISHILLLSSLTLVQAMFAQNREIMGEYKIGIIGRDQKDASYQATESGAKATALALSQRYSIDVEVVSVTPDSTQGGTQQSALEQLFIENADGFIISPDGSDTVKNAVEFAQQEGQEIVFFESAIKEIQPLASIVAGEFEAGQLAGQTMLKLLPTKARAALLISETPSPAMLERLKGARSALGYKRIETMVRCKPDYLSAIEAIRTAEERDRNDLIRGWIFLGDWPLLGMPGLPWKHGELPCVVIQSTPYAFIYLDQGYVNAMITHPYYDWGSMSVEALIGKLHNQSVPEQLEITTKPQLIDRQNIDDYRGRWKNWLK